MKHGLHITAPESTSAAYVINPSHQSVFNFYSFLALLGNGWKTLSCDSEYTEQLRLEICWSNICRKKGGSANVEFDIWGFCWAHGISDFAPEWLEYWWIGGIARDSKTTTKETQERLEWARRWCKGSDEGEIQLKELLKKVEALEMAKPSLSTKTITTRTPRGTSSAVSPSFCCTVAVWRVWVRILENIRQVAMILSLSNWTECVLTFSLSLLRIAIYEEWCLLGCYAVWLL
jgi:hypothetical protein